MNRPRNVSVNALLLPQGLLGEVALAVRGDVGGHAVGRELPQRLLGCALAGHVDDGQQVACGCARVCVCVRACACMCVCEGGVID